jgi:sugar phosphate isomerase/epimerase
LKIGCSSLTLQNYWRVITRKEGADNPWSEPNSKELIQMIRWSSGLGFESIAFWISSHRHLESLSEDLDHPIARSIVDEGILIDSLTCDFSAPWIFAESQDFITKNFERISAVARSLGAKYIETVTPPVPSEVTWSKFYIGAPLPEMIKLKPDFIWDKCWQKYLQSLRSIARVLEASSLKLAIEPRPKEIIDNTDSLLRTFDSIQSDTIGGLLDTSHLHLIKEVPSISIHKLDQKLFEIQASENDGITAYHWPPGQGEIDWNQIINALRKIGYDGTISIDVTGMDVEREALEGKDFIKKKLGRQVVRLA